MKTQPVYESMIVTRPCTPQPPFPPLYPVSPKLKQGMVWLEAKAVPSE